jgi:hypothetical protein
VDAPRFDAFARSLVSPASRRRLIGGLAAGALGLFGRGGAQARICSAPGTICREHANCCSGLCGPKDRTGRRRCTACQSAGECPQPAELCEVATCTGGVCGIRPGHDENAGCFRICPAHDTPCQAGCGTACDCIRSSDGVTTICVDIDTFIGTCATNADCPDGVYCSPYHGDGQLRRLCVRPCPCPA